MAEVETEAEAEAGAAAAADSGELRRCGSVTRGGEDGRSYARLITSSHAPAEDDAEADTEAEAEEVEGAELMVAGAGCGEAVVCSSCVRRSVSSD